MIRIGLLLTVVSYLAGSGCVSKVHSPDREEAFRARPQELAPARTPSQRKPVPAMERRTARAAPLPPVQPLPPPPTHTIETLGHSVEGRPIDLHVFGNRGPCLFVFSGIHGSEPTSVDIADGLIGILQREPALYRDCRVAVIPRLNPDGLERGRRANANRVDLNRNFPARNWRRRAGHGSAPASEPETKLLLGVMERLQPSAVISVHSIQSQPPCNNFDGPGEQLAQLLSQYNGYAVKPTIGYPTPGSFGSWAGVDLGIPTVTLELPRRQPGPQAWERNREAMYAVVRAMPQLGAWQAR